MITGFRWHLGGAQHALRRHAGPVDLRQGAWRTASRVSALAGRREIMELGGLKHDKERVFLLSTTHGAETHALAAAIATMRVYRREDVVGVLDRQGARLRQGVRRRRRSGLERHFEVLGRECNLVYGARDASGGRPSPFGRCSCRRRSSAACSRPPSSSASRTPTRTSTARSRRSAERWVYRRALESGVEQYLGGGRSSRSSAPATDPNAAPRSSSIPGPAPLRVLCLGAHSDDIEIGCGATLLHLLRRRGGAALDMVVFSGSGSPVRAREARSSARRFGREAKSLHVAVHRFRDGFFPSQAARIKDVFETLKRRPSPT